MFAPYKIKPHFVSAESVPICKVSMHNVGYQTCIRMKKKVKSWSADLESFFTTKSAIKISRARYLQNQKNAPKRVA